MVLKARGLQVSDSQQARIDSCDDLATLKQWAEAALTAATAQPICSRKSRPDLLPLTASLRSLFEDFFIS